MINATDLRIGNLYEVDGSIFRVSKIDKGGFQGELVKKANGMHTNGGRQQPIPLTPDILDKLHIIQLGMNLFEYKKIRLECLYPIKYLHQLQNLFYAQLGEELEINLT